MFMGHNNGQDVDDPLPGRHQMLPFCDTNVSLWDSEMLLSMPQSQRWEIHWLWFFYSPCLSSLHHQKFQPFLSISAVCNQPYWGPGMWLKPWLSVMSAWHTEVCCILTHSDHGNADCSLFMSLHTVFSGQFSFLTVHIGPWGLVNSWHRLTFIQEMWCQAPFLQKLLLTWLLGGGKHISLSKL